MQRTGWPSVVTGETALDPDTALRIAHPAKQVSFSSILCEALTLLDLPQVLVYDSQEGVVWSAGESGLGDSVVSGMVAVCITYGSLYVLLAPVTGQTGTSLAWEVVAENTGGFQPANILASALDPIQKKSAWGLCGWLAQRLPNPMVFAVNQQPGTHYGRLLVCQLPQTFRSLGFRGADDVTIRLVPTHWPNATQIFEGGST